MSVTAEQACQWVSVTDAASAGQVSERTVWRWIHAGLVESRAEKRGQRETRLVNVESLPPTDTDRHESDSGSQRQPVPDSGVESQGSNGASHEVSPDAAGQRGGFFPPRETGSKKEPISDHHASLLEHQAQEITFLRQQLQAREDARREEMERIDQERAEMRRLLLTSQQLAHELAQQLEQRALPAASEPVSQVTQDRRVRWYWPFGRR